MIGIGPEIEGDAARYIDAGRIAFGIGGRIVGEFGLGIDTQLFTRCRARTIIVIGAEDGHRMGMITHHDDQRIVFLRGKILGIFDRIVEHDRIEDRPFGIQ